jgi:hypothetical protein
LPTLTRTRFSVGIDLINLPEHPSGASKVAIRDLVRALRLHTVTNAIISIAPLPRRNHLLRVQRKRPQRLDKSRDRRDVIRGTGLVIRGFRGKMLHICHTFPNAPSLSVAR